MSDWKIFRGSVEHHDGIADLPDPPPWRQFGERDTDRDSAYRPWEREIDRRDEERGSTYQPREREVELVNAALCLRRPVYVTGPPGTGKSSLAYAVARELKLGPVLRWSINSRSNLSDGLYHYDALARLRDIQAEQSPSGSQETSRTEHDIGRYVKLNELGTALLANDRPRVLLIDEIDKSDIDLPNDLLHVFEEGEFEIPELVRIADQQPDVEVMPSDSRGPGDKVTIHRGRVRCQEFPFVVLTSNGECELAPAFLRRCLRLDIPAPDEAHLRSIVEAHLGDVDAARAEDLIRQFLHERDDENRLVATDQLLNAIFLVTRDRAPENDERKAVVGIILRELGR